MWAKPQHNAAAASRAAGQISAELLTHFAVEDTLLMIRRVGSAIGAVKRLS
jgi:hypothetical protein